MGSHQKRLYCTSALIIESAGLCRRNSYIIPSFCFDDCAAEHVGQIQFKSGDVHNTLINPFCARASFKG